MFYCPLHNWYSDEEPCKACFKTVETTTSTGVSLPNDFIVDKEGFLFKYTKSDLMQAFNDAIDHVIELVKQHHVPFTERDVQLIFKLQALKK